METVIHTFTFDLHEEDGRKGWEDLKEKLRGYPHKMESYCTAHDSYYMPDLDGTTVKLDVKHLFENQWNAETKDGRKRLFDWAVEVLPHNEKLKRGHYLEQTKEMQEIRRNTNHCGYCGNQEPAAAGSVFCMKCLDSAYLKQEDLHLLRMLPVEQFMPKRPPLTEAETAYLLPAYKKAQIYGVTESGKRRIEGIRADLERDLKSSIEKATAKYNGLKWLLDNAINIDNVIYYDHTGRFCFGWRNPLGEAPLSLLLEVISEFRWPYDIKTADGRTLSGN